MGLAGDDTCPNPDACNTPLKHIELYATFDGNTPGTQTVEGSHAGKPESSAQKLAFAPDKRNLSLAGVRWNPKNDHAVFNRDDKDHRVKKASQLLLWTIKNASQESLLRAFNRVRASVEYQTLSFDKA